MESHHIQYKPDKYNQVVFFENNLVFHLNDHLKNLLHQLYYLYYKFQLKNH